MEYKLALITKKNLLIACEYLVKISSLVSKCNKTSYQILKYYLFMVSAQKYLRTVELLACTRGRFGAIEEIFSKDRVCRCRRF